MKYILVTGGVMSGVGKGIIASSIGTLLKSCGVHVTSIKIDPYLNIDAGTFSPYEHGVYTSPLYTMFLTIRYVLNFFPQAKSMCWTMAAKWIWIWAIMNDFSMSPCTVRITLRRAKYTKKSSIERDGVITWAKPFKVSIFQMQIMYSISLYCTYYELLKK